MRRESSEVTGLLLRTRSSMSHGSVQSDDDDTDERRSDRDAGRPATCCHAANVPSRVTGVATVQPCVPTTSVSSYGIGDRRTIWFLSLGVKRDYLALRFYPLFSSHKVAVKPNTTWQHSIPIKGRALQPRRPRPPYGSKGHPQKDSYYQGTKVL